MASCKSCRYKADVNDGLCPICGIEQDKPKKELTKDEQLIRHAARGIYGVSLLHTLGFALMIIALPSFVAPVFEKGLGQAENPGMILFVTIFAAIMTFIFLALAIGFRRYAKWAFYMAAAIYPILILMNLFSPSLGLIALLLCSYYIFNQNARAIFGRTLKPAALARRESTHHAESDPDLGQRRP